MKNQIESLHVGVQYKDFWHIRFQGNASNLVSVTPNMGDLLISLEDGPRELRILGTHVSGLEVRDSRNHFVILLNYTSNEGGEGPQNKAMEIGVGKSNGPLFEQAKCFVQSLNETFYNKPKQ